MEKLSEEAKQIVKQNLYLCLATVKLDNTPWVSPVYFNYDENFTLYWRSGKDSLHSQLITKNSHVAIAIFNSQVPWGTGTGVYLEAIAAEVPPKELTKALKAFYGGPLSTTRLLQQSEILHRGTPTKNLPSHTQKVLDLRKRRDSWTTNRQKNRN